VIIDDAFDGMSCSESYKLFKSFVQKGCKGKTIVYASNSYRFLKFCNTFLYLEDGEILESGPKKQLSEFNEFKDVDLESDVRINHNPLRMKKIMIKSHLNCLNASQQIKILQTAQFANSTSGTIFEIKRW